MASDSLPPEFWGLKTESLPPDKQPVPVDQKSKAFDYAFYYQHKNDSKITEFFTTPTENPQLEKNFYVRAFRRIKPVLYTGYSQLEETNRLIEKYEQNTERYWYLINEIHVRIKCHFCFNGPVFSWINGTYVDLIFPQKQKAVVMSVQDNRVFNRRMYSDYFRDMLNHFIETFSNK